MSAEPSATCPSMWFRVTSQQGSNCAAEGFPTAHGIPFTLADGKLFHQVDNHK